MTELELKIEECNRLHEEVNQRPIKIELKGNLVSYEGHERSKLIEKKIKDCELHYENVSIYSSIVKVQVISTNDDLIFYGITVETLKGQEIKPNLLVEFQSCDCIDRYEKPE